MRSSGKFLPILVAGLVLGACNDGSGPDTGRLVINLTDAPGDLDGAFVSIREVILIGAEGDESVEGRKVLTPQTTGYIDLLQLTGGNQLELVDAAVASGVYSEMRLVIDEAYVQLTDGRVFATTGADLPAGMVSSGTLRCPSCSSSGFKVKFMDGGLDVRENAVVLIDFDVAQSFGHDAGQSGAWVMHPVLRATSTTRLATIMGTVTLASGVSLPACGGAATTLALFKPTATLGAEAITGVTDAQGAYRIENLLGGAYTMGILTDLTFTDSEEILTLAATPTPAALNLPAGDSVIVDYQITAANCH